MAFAASDRHGGGHLRAFWPAEALRAAGCDAEAHAALPLPGGGWDVVVVHRPLDDGRLAAVRRLREAGARVVVDEDDDLHSVADSGNDLAVKLCTPERLERHDRAIAEADALAVATPRLAEVYGPLAREVHVCRNRLPAWVALRAFYPRGPQPVRVGWAGITLTHRADLAWIRPAARPMLRGARFTTVGDPRTPVLLGLDRAEAFPFQHSMEALYDLMARADVGIVPLAPTEFNAAKSWLKALEYMALGKPVVATDLPEQRALVRHGVDGFLAATPGEFAEAVQELVGDPELRRRMGAAAAARAAEVNDQVLAAGEWSEAAGILART